MDHSFVTYPGYEGEISTVGYAYFHLYNKGVMLEWDLLDTDLNCKNGPSPSIEKSCSMAIHDGWSCTDYNRLPQDGYFNKNIIKENPWNVK